MIEDVFRREPLKLAISMSLLACFCVCGVSAQDTLNAKLERAETMLLGKTSPDQSVDARLNAIELGLFGKAKHGNVTKRVDSVLEFIGGRGGQSLPAANQGVGAEPLNSSNPPSYGASLPATFGAATSQTDTGSSSSRGRQKQNASVPTSTDPNDSSSSAGSRTAWPYSTAGQYSNSYNGNRAGASTNSSASDSSNQSNFGSNDGLNNLKSASKHPSLQSTSSASNQSTSPHQKASAAGSSTDKKTQTAKNSWSQKTKSSPPTLAPLKAQEAKMAQPAASPLPTAIASKTPVPPLEPSASKNVSQARELLREGLHEYSMGNYRDAELTFRKVLTVDPRSSDAFYNLGSIAERNRDYVMALTNYRAALNLSPHDKDYLAATVAMEKQLSSQSSATPSVSSPAAQRAKDPLKGGQHSGSAAAPGAAPTNSDAPDVAPRTPVASGEPFQLSGTKNDTLMNSTQFDNRFGPMMNASQGSVPMSAPPMLGVNQGNPPVFNVNQKPPKGKSGTLGTVLKVGTRAALYSSGLHCPICRMTGGSLHF